ncbi:hypothetical protein [Azospirillum argentinense]
MTTSCGSEADSEMVPTWSECAKMHTAVMASALAADHTAAEPYAR